MAAQATAWGAQSPALPLHLVVGMINTKDIAGFLAPLARCARSLAAAAIPNEANAVPAEAVCAAAKEAGLDAEAAADMPAAIRAIAGRGPDPARILICGSLYLAGTVLADNG